MISMVEDTSVTYIGAFLEFFLSKETEYYIENTQKNIVSKRRRRYTTVDSGIYAVCSGF